jgi:transposase
MLSLPVPVRILLYTQPTDMRKGFDSLAALVREELAEDPLSGHLFVFRSRRGNRVKLLFWDRDGYCLIYKRLEQGSFRFPAVSADEPSAQVSDRDLLLLWGIDPTSVRRQKRYTRPA